MLTATFAVLQAVEIVSHTISDLSRAMIAALVGKQCCKLLALQRATQASLDVDFSREVVTIYALRANLEQAVQHIQGVVNAYKYVCSPAVFVPCDAVPCWAVLCCAVLCCAVLVRVRVRSTNKHRKRVLQGSSEVQLAYALGADCIQHFCQH